MAARTNRKSSGIYAKRAGQNDKLGARRHYGQWISCQQSARVGARIGADPVTGRRQPADGTGMAIPLDQMPKPDDRCVVCKDPGGVRRTSDAPRMHHGCARRLARRGMRADQNRARQQAEAHAQELRARDLASRAAARELKQVAQPVLTPWTAADVADLADKAAPAPTLDASVGDRPTVTT